MTKGSKMQLVQSPSLIDRFGQLSQNNQSQLINQPSLADLINKSFIKERVHAGVILINIPYHNAQPNKWKVLVVLGKETGKLSFPKGHGNNYETSKSCAERELFEETGLTRNIEKHSFLQVKVGQTDFFIIAEYGECPILHPQDNDEITLASWIGKDELKTANTNFSLRYVINRWNALVHLIRSKDN